MTHPSAVRDARPAARGAAVVGVGRARSPRSQAWLILVLGALVTLGPLTIDMYLPALPRIAKDLHASPSLAQLTLTGTLAGIGLGNLIAGPLSDSLGRRLPVVVGSALHVLASVGCAFAPNIAALCVLRVLEGAGAAAATVVALAMVGDLFDGSEAARVLSRLMLVLGVSPIFAPALGTAVLLGGSWRWVFGVLAVLGGALLLIGRFLLPETLPRGRRRPLSARSVASAYWALLNDVRFVLLVLASGLVMSGLLGYIAGAPFVLQEQYGLDQQSFSVVFAVGAVALIGAAQINLLLLRRFAPRQIVLCSLALSCVSGFVLLALATTHTGGLTGFVVSIWLVLGFIGFALPNLPALALSRHHEAAGSASALIGAAQFGAGAVVAPLVGMLGDDDRATGAVIVAGIALAFVMVVFASRGAEATAAEQ